MARKLSTVVSVLKRMSLCRDPLWPSKPEMLAVYRRDLWSKAVVLSRARFCSPGDIWQCLETFLVVTGEELLTCSGEDRDGAKSYSAQEPPAPHFKEVCALQCQYC